MPQADTRHMYHSYRLDIINIIIIIIIIIISIIVTVVIIIVINKNTVRKRCFDRPICGMTILYWSQEERILEGSSLPECV